MLCRLGLAFGSAAFFVAGSLLMRPAAGFSRLVPTLGVIGCYVVGVVLDMFLVRAGNEVGPAVVLVIGLEAAFTAVLAHWLYDERLNGVRVVALVLVMSGVLVLGWQPSEASEVRHPTPGAGPLPVEPVAQLGSARDAELGVRALEM